MKYIIKLRNILLTFLCLALTFTLFGCKSEKGEDEKSESVMKIISYKIGKADCFIITCSGFTAMIDAGEEEDAQEILKKLSATGIKQIDLMIITHFDKDHVGGAGEIIKNMSVKMLLVPYIPNEAQSKGCKCLLNAIGNLGLEMEQADEEQSIINDNFSIYIYPPNASYDEENDISLVVKVNHMEKSFLFTGDITQKRIEDMIEENFDFSCSFLKVPHHGKYDDATKELISLSGCEYALITCSDKNPPDEPILDALKEAKAITYESRNGDIIITSGKNGINVTQGK